VPVVVVGCSHRSLARRDVLEAMTVGPGVLAKALADLRSRDHLDEVVVVSTCLRTEVYADTRRFHGAAGAIRDFLADWSGYPPEAFSDGVYEYFDEVAVDHLFRVAAGLESAVLGEGEILRQVRSAWDAARAEGTVGLSLGAAFRLAIETGKRVRAETGIARGVTSLSHTAVMLAAEHVASANRLDAATPCPGAAALAGRTALVLGAGEMGSAVAALLAEGPGIGGLLVASRTFDRAAAVARRVGARALPWTEVPDALTRADVVVSATTAPSTVLGVDAIPPGRPLVIVDLARPRDVDPAVGRLPGVTLFDMTDLEARARAARTERAAEIPAAEAIVVAEVARWAGLVAAREVAPVVAALHERAEAVRAEELRRAEARLAGLDPAQRRAVEALTRRIVAKLLHDPTVNLKAAAGDERGSRLACAVAELWDLPCE
jgi:glutamyl-tRNA reductase